MASVEFSRKLKELRLRAGFSQKQVYEHFNIPQSTFSSWETGKAEPSADVLLKLYDFYQCDVLKDFNADNVSELSPEEYDIVTIYRDLDDYGKDLIITILKKESERSFKQRMKESSDRLTELSKLKKKQSVADTDPDSVNNGEIKKTEK